MSESIEEWVAREAQTWTREVWDGLNNPCGTELHDAAIRLGLIEWDSDGGYEPRDGTWMLTEKGEVAMALRDKVAGELRPEVSALIRGQLRTYEQIRAVVPGVTPEVVVVAANAMALRDGLIKVQANPLAATCRPELTDFGHEIVRVLEDGHG